MEPLAQRAHTGPVNIVLGVLGTLCCLVLPALVLSAPFVFVGVRSIRARPERRVTWVLGLSTLNALATGTVLTIAGFVMGMSAASEDAGTILNVLVSVGCVGGTLSGFVVTALILSLATRGRPAP